MGKLAAPVVPERHELDQLLSPGLAGLAAYTGLDDTHYSIWTTLRHATRLPRRRTGRPTLSKPSRRRLRPSPRNGLRGRRHAVEEGPRSRGDLPVLWCVFPLSLLYSGALEVLSPGVNLATRGGRFEAAEAL